MVNASFVRAGETEGGMKMARSSLDISQTKFDAEFDSSYEDQANRVRGKVLDQL
jgi:hypothetical protein